jgi:hypothetical protein
MQSYTLQTWYNCAQLHTIQPPHCSWFMVILQVIPICENSIALYTYRYHHQSIALWPPTRKWGIYMGYLSPSIIKYLEPLIEDLLTARYADCIFNEDHFPALGGEFKYHTEYQEINWDAIDTLKEDPCTKETDWKFRESLSCKTLQTICQTHLPTPKVSQNHRSLQGMCRKE